MSIQLVVLCDECLTLHRLKKSEMVGLHEAGLRSGEFSV